MRRRFSVNIIGIRTPLSPAAQAPIPRLHRNYARYDRKMDSNKKNEGPYDALNEKTTATASKNKNSWATSSLSLEQNRQQQRDGKSGDFEYNPRGSRYQDIDDGMLPTAAQRQALNQWPPSRIIGALLAVVLFIVFSFVEIETPKDSTVSFKNVNRCLAVLFAMISLWLFSVFSPNLTAILPIPLYAMFELDSSTNYASKYLTDIGVLFIGVFIVCSAMEACNVHKRIALAIIKKIGRTPATVLLGFMIPPWFLSLFASNAGMCAMILPIAMATMETTIKEAEDKGDQEEVKALQTYEKGLYMAIAYSATVGGVGTIIATPPNGVLVDQILAEYNESLSFGGWIAAFLPLSIVLQICCFVIMYLIYGRAIKRISRSFIDREYAKLGRMNRDEMVVCAVFVFMIGWMVLHEFTTKQWIGNCTVNKKLRDDILDRYACDHANGKWKGTLGTGAIAFLSSTILFLVPSKMEKNRNLINWKMAESGVPWGIILLMGGGNALSKAFKETNTTVWIANFLEPLANLPEFWLVLLISTLVAFLTEITSNTATTSILLPVLMKFADNNHLHPMLLATPTALAASMAFMLPIATPTNAVVLGSGKVPFLGFVKAGWKMNFVGILLVTIFVMTTGRLVYNFDNVPDKYRKNWPCMEPNATVACP